VDQVRPLTPGWRATARFRLPPDLVALRLVPRPPR
jgi:hypothetical protein